MERAGLYDVSQAEAWRVSFDESFWTWWRGVGGTTRLVTDQCWPGVVQDHPESFCSVTNSVR